MILKTCSSGLPAASDVSPARQLLRDGIQIQNLPGMVSRDHAIANAA
jgi:hypothetical protein